MRAALVALSLFTLTAHGASLECFTDEPRAYSFNIGAQKSGQYAVRIDHETGRLKGMTYMFMIKDVARPQAHNDYLVKRYRQGVPYSITYALYCKIGQN